MDLFEAVVKSCLRFSFLYKDVLSRCCLVLLIFVDLSLEALASVSLLVLKFLLVDADEAVFRLKVIVISRLKDELRLVPLRLGLVGFILPPSSVRGVDASGTSPMLTIGETSIEVEGCLGAGSKFGLLIILILGWFCCLDVVGNSFVLLFWELWSGMPLLLKCCCNLLTTSDLLALPIEESKVLIPTEFIGRPVRLLLLIECCWIDRTILFIIRNSLESTLLEALSTRLGLDACLVREDRVRDSLAAAMEEELARDFDLPPNKTLILLLVLFGVEGELTNFALFSELT